MAHLPCKFGQKGSTWNLEELIGGSGPASGEAGAAAFLGLEHIVRGDVMLEDGSTVRLDKLCDRHGLPHLPYLEDLPPELEVDWDAEDE